MLVKEEVVVCRCVVRDRTGRGWSSPAGLVGEVWRKRSDTAGLDTAIWRRGGVGERWRGGTAAIDGRTGGVEDGNALGEGAEERRRERRLVTVTVTNSSSAGLGCVSWLDTMR